MKVLTTIFGIVGVCPVKVVEELSYEAISKAVVAHVAEEYNDKAKIKDAIMLLLLSYAKATAKFPEENQDLFNNLVVEWGTILNTVVKKLD